MPLPMAVARQRSARWTRPLLAVAAIRPAAQRQTVAGGATLGTLWPFAATLGTLRPVAATLSTLGPVAATLGAEIATRAAAATVSERRTIGRSTTLAIVMRRFHHLVL